MARASDASACDAQEVQQSVFRLLQHLVGHLMGHTAIRELDVFTGQNAIGPFRVGRSICACFGFQESPSTTFDELVLADLDCLHGLLLLVQA